MLFEATEVRQILSSFPGKIAIGILLHSCPFWRPMSSKTGEMKIPWRCELVGTRDELANRHIPAPQHSLDATRHCRVSQNQR